MALTKPTKNQVAGSDLRLHRNISFAKSGLRIIAGGLLCAGQLFAAGALLILAEALGVAEELV
jgi:hypothetical protein